MPLPETPESEGYSHVHRPSHGPRGSGHGSREMAGAPPAQFPAGPWLLPRELNEMLGPWAAGPLESGLCSVPRAEAGPGAGAGPGGAITASLGLVLALALTQANQESGVGMGPVALRPTSTVGDATASPSGDKGVVAMP